MHSHVAVSHTRTVPSAEADASLDCDADNPLIMPLCASTVWIREPVTVSHTDISLSSFPDASWPSERNSSERMPPACSSVAM